MTSSSRSRGPIARNSGQARPTKIFIVGRDSLSGSLLAEALSRENAIHAAAIHPSDLARACATQKPDIVIVSADISGVADAGFRVVQSTLVSNPEVSFVMLLDKVVSGQIVRAFRSGVRGVFCTGEPVASLVHCIEHVRQGFIWADKPATDSLLDAFRHIPVPNLIGDQETQRLTVREMQVVECIACGRTNKDAARELHLSEHTVKNYLFRAFEKLGVTNRVQLLYCLSLRGVAVNPESRSD